MFRKKRVWLYSVMGCGSTARWCGSNSVQAWLKRRAGVAESPEYTPVGKRVQVEEHSLDPYHDGKLVQIRRRKLPHAHLYRHENRTDETPRDQRGRDRDAGASRAGQKSDNGFENVGYMPERRLRERTSPCFSMPPPGTATTR